MKFLHAADLHIDSPLRGLDTMDVPADEVRGATRRAVEQMVDLALAEAVDFVVIAGDIFDGPWPDMRTGIWTSQQLARLDDIPVFLLRGNHDAQSKVRQAVSWPANVKEFPVDRPDTFIVSRCNAALHGQGFATPSVSQDLASSYPPPRPGMFNIGVLHTSLTGDPDHASYAPTTEATLIDRGYDYWALGHVHQRRTVREHSPCIVYSGNTQGRHIKELEPKGCLIVEAAPGQTPLIQFHETDVLRWRLVEAPLQPHHSLSDLFDVAMERLQAAQAAALGKTVVARLVLSGACAAHEELLREPEAFVEATAELRNRALQLGSLWLEKIKWQIAPVVDIHQLRAGQDLLGELLRDLRDCSSDTDRLQQLASSLASLQAKAPLALREAQIELDSAEQLSVWLEQAEGMLVALLQEGVTS